MQSDVKNIGVKIRELRKLQKLTQEALCETGEELSVRHLSRIERGESSPTIKVLFFIANRLSIPIAQLLDDYFFPQPLPKEFLKLKDQITLLSLCNDPNHTQKQAALFKKIDNHFYKSLPEEEKLFINAQKAISKTYLTKDITYADDILKNYFSCIQTNETNSYTENDLLIIQLYFYSCFHKGDISDIFETLLSQVIDQTKHAVYLESIIINDILISAMDIFIHNNQYHRLMPLINASKHLMNENKFFHKQPIVQMAEGKFYLFVQKDQKEAKRKYLKGIKIARAFNDELLSKQVTQEWEKDLQLFTS